MKRFFATGFGSGLLRPAPGTWGSLASLPFAWALHTLGSWSLFFAATVLLFFVGVWLTAEITRDADDHDPSEIVVDEFVGQWIALWPVSLGAAMAGVQALALWPGIVVAVLAFRLFDIWKPGPVGWADRRHDAWGVMLDDVVAGVLAALSVAALAAFAHGVLV